MKRILILIPIFFLGFAVKAGKYNDKPKQFIVQGTVEEWGNVLYCIDQSDAPSKVRTTAREMI
jgi:hypothetical protein